jgi:hypothetical protein
VNASALAQPLQRLKHGQTYGGGARERRGAQADEAAVRCRLLGDGRRGRNSAVNFDIVAAVGGETYASFYVVWRGSPCAIIRLVTIADGHAGVANALQKSIIACVTLKTCKATVSNTH